jgi:hypothetical protein
MYIDKYEDSQNGAQNYYRYVQKIVTDLLKALLGNDSVNTFQCTRGQQYSRRGVFYVVRAETAIQMSCNTPLQQ